MARTTAELVAEIFETDVDISATPFINDASLLVTAVLGASGLSEAMLTRIETWVAAHLYANRDPRVMRERVSSIDITYEVNYPGKGLESSRYGQQAMVLDTTGKLAAYNRKITKGAATQVQVLSLGTNHSDKVSFESD